MLKTKLAKRWLRERWLETILFLGFLGIVAWFVNVGYDFWPEPVIQSPAAQFLGDSAYGHVLAQTDLGARPTGSEASIATGDYIIEQLEAFGWEVETQPFTYQGVAARNIIGKAGAGPIALVGAHYDTRRSADRDTDPAARTKPVIGANDGASGVAVLLELARVLAIDQVPYEVWLVFFDAEDNGGLDGWEFVAGSRYMAEHLAVEPGFVIIVDMIGDADQQIFRERNSALFLQDRLWEIASDLGYGEYIIDEFKWAILDDHTPFQELGIIAVDIIDFDYPHWHTSHDTADKVSPASLERVGRVLQVFLEGAPFQGE